VLTGTSYTSGSFVGVNGITWNYTGARNESGFEIDGNGILFRDSGSYVRATIPGGVNEVSVDYRKGFTGGGNRQLEIRVNGEVVATSPSFGSASGRDDTIYTLSVDTLGLTGDVVVEIRAITNNQIVFDNITWN